MRITAGHKRSAEIRSTNYQFKTKVNMKNKTLILVGTRHFFYALLVAVIFCGCEPAMPQNSSKAKDTFDMGQYKIVEIDSCEYIVSDVYAGYDICHKGNCKFCAERSKK